MRLSLSRNEDTRGTMVAEVGATTPANPAPNSGGDSGGRIPVRSHLLFLQRRLAKADALMESEWEPIVQWCRDIIKGTNAADARTKMRANELLASLMDKGIGVAVDLDKMDRLDRGAATESVEHKHAVMIKGIAEGDV